MRLPRAAAFRFGQGHVEAVFNFYFNSRQDQKLARQIHALERVAILFFGVATWRSERTQLLQKFARNHETTKGRKDDTNIPLLNWGGPPLGVQILYTFALQTQKWASNKSNSSVISSCASCGFFRSRLESQSWNSFNPFPSVNRASAGVPTPPDSHQNWHKTVVKPKFCISSLLTESAGVMKSKLQCQQRIRPVLNIYYYSLTGWYWTPGDIHNPTRKVAALRV